MENNSQKPKNKKPGISREPKAVGATQSRIPI